ncbi:probable sugar phosphate/phosphate translocator At1g06470 [Dioscorea cayenensis subsp. rotundata]|uniref:Probable sugar phosphate/phosphate translocator At1g06470 n=1 Tax=Dioscorea cayennensis subsp. rotundata TaxID=55577 RepID=A0AB40BAX8_DIOCR|nr:probable sugar phosphate/phosphate translocator At1g06470 [Dioscorea cayenensis subsp. rotundata]
MGDVEPQPSMEPEQAPPPPELPLLAAPVIKALEIRNEASDAVIHEDLSFSQRCIDGKEDEAAIRLPIDGSLPDEKQRGKNFRQRSMHSGEGFGNGKRIGTLDVENGIHPSDSRLKLDMFAQSAQSSVSAVVVLKTLFYIVVWYTFSTCLTLYNKTLLGDKLGKFPAPLLMNTFHFGLQAVLSKIIVCIQSRGSDAVVVMTWKDYFIKVVPTALGTALDINLSNASLVFISVTFATMCKSASPIFLLLFAFAFRLESPSIKLLGIIVIISVGVLLTVAKETEFDFWGFVFVMLAAVMSGFRWSMTQILLQKEAYGLKDPMTLMSYVTPVMAVSTLILSFVMDPWREFDSNAYFNNSWHIIRSCMLMLIGGSLAFFMVLIEYILISVTSAVTVTIAGVVKEAVTILVAVFYFHDHFTLLKGLGLLTIMVGVSLFNWYKYEKLKNNVCENGEMMSANSNGAPRYVILDDMDTLDDDT